MQIRLQTDFSEDTIKSLVRHNFIGINLWPDTVFDSVFLSGVRTYHIRKPYVMPLPKIIPYHYNTVTCIMETRRIDKFSLRRRLLWVHNSPYSYSTPRYKPRVIQLHCFRHTWTQPYRPWWGRSYDTSTYCRCSSVRECAADRRTDTDNDSFVWTIERYLHHNGVYPHSFWA